MQCHVLNVKGSSRGLTFILQSLTPDIKQHLRIAARKLCVIVISLGLLCAPAAALASKGQRNYKRGLEFEAAQQWEKAVEEFALAVSAEPSNAEYQLHYRRALFNASQVFMRQGAALVERGDYIAAYNAFRRAYAYDQVNELARSMMDRVLRLQLDKEVTTTGDDSTVKDPTDFQLSPTALGTAAGESQPVRAQKAEPLQGARSEQLRVINYSGDLEGFIKYLARELRLNAVFDRDFPRRIVSVDLQDVTAAQALDYVFLTQGLFFQKLTNRTILVADQTKRPQYQQLVLRTFYLSNIDPNDARALITASIPPQAGRQPVITANKATNSITVRDTVENVRLVADLLRSIDKDRAEVVMDVQIFEVSRTDLMQFGNQIGSESSLTNLGGIQKGLSVLGGSRQVVTQAIATPTALGAALIVPATALSAFQRKDNTRLIASTQVHAFDGEKSTAHIGQRVPVQTAAVTPYGSVSAGDGDKQQTGVAQGLFGGNGYPVIQYEKTGLTLEFTPQVAPNLDVQVKMSIKSNDVSNAASETLTPTFTERNIEGTARIQNNRTMMIASVAQNQQSRGRQGLPLLGLVPILGRFFTAPRRNDHQTDIVIAVTPHVLRAPSYTSHDEEIRPSGTMTTPNSDTLEALLHEVEREEQIAAARRIPRHAEVRIQDAEQQTFVPAPKALMSATITAEERAPVQATPAASPSPVAFAPGAVEAVYDRPLRPRTVSSSAEMKARVYAPENSTANADAAAAAVPSSQPRSAAQLMLMPEPHRMSVGERRQLKLVLKTDAPLGLVASSLRFDPRVLAVRAVSLGNMFTTTMSRPAVSHTVSPEGILLFSITPTAGTSSFTGGGVLLNIEVEALAPGATDMLFGSEDVHLMATDGRKVLLKVLAGSVSIRD